MHYTRKIASLLLALVMVFALATTAFAVVEEGSITINNTVDKATYAIYRLFVLESYAGGNDTDAHSYKVAEKWESYFAENAEGRNYFDVDKNGYVTAKSGMNAAEFAKKALAYAGEHNIAADANATGNGGSVTVNTLPLGYYLIDSSVGALCSLTTTDPNGVVIEKNGAPTLDKQVQENSEANQAPNYGWGNRNDANVGETVYFRATITVQGFAKDYVMHDKMDDGLTYDKVSGVTLNGTTVGTEKYEVVTSNTDGCTFEVVFKSEFCESLKTGDKIVVSYQATLNSNAVVAEPENNNAHLSYKDNNGESHNTQDSNTKTYTWEMPVLKYANGNTSNVLAGAKFSLYTTENCEGDPIKFTAKEGNIYQVTKDGAVSEITTTATGKFEIEGLDAGTYYLKETDAPAGYNKLNTVVKVVISHEGKITVDNGTTETTEVQVNNNSGTELPSTGGMGTTIFYILGSVLVLAAGVLLVTKKRMSTEG